MNKHNKEILNTLRLVPDECTCRSEPIKDKDGKLDWKHFPCARHIVRYQALNGTLGRDPEYWEWN